MWVARSEPPGVSPPGGSRGWGLGVKRRASRGQSQAAALGCWGGSNAGGVDGPREGSGGCCSKDGGRQSSHVEMEDVAQGTWSGRASQ